MSYQNIKPLSPKAYQIFKALADMARADEEHAAKLNRSEFMPLCIEIVYKVSGSEEHVSLAHYGEENGDLMRDPEMIFFHDRKEGKAYAMNYRNDYGGTWEVSIKEGEDGRPSMVNQARQRQHTEFAELWLKNIKSQQRLKI